MTIKPELKWVPRPSAVDPWLRLPSAGDPEQAIMFRLEEYRGVRPLGSGEGAEVTVERGYFRTSASVETVEALVARARKEAGLLSDPVGTRGGA